MVEAARIALASREAELPASTGLAQISSSRPLRSPLDAAWTATRGLGYVLDRPINRLLQPVATTMVDPIAAGGQAPIEFRF